MNEYVTIIWPLSLYLYIPIVRHWKKMGKKEIVESAKLKVSNARLPELFPAVPEVC